MEVPMYLPKKEVRCVRVAIVIMTGILSGPSTCSEKTADPFEHSGLQGIVHLFQLSLVSYLPTIFWLGISLYLKEQYKIQNENQHYCVDHLFEPL
jgi:hypothetical protein